MEKHRRLLRNATVSRVAAKGGAQLPTLLRIYL